jgi:dolichol-phosphate mannosyltransferase
MVEPPEQSPEGPTGGAGSLVATEPPVPPALLTRAGLIYCINRLLGLRLVRFGMVGASGVLVNLLVLRVLFGELHWASYVASALAVEVSIGTNFLGNNWWTFRQRDLSPLRFLRFNLASLGGLAITTVIFTVLMQRFALPYMLADLVGIAVATVWNFAASIFWTWAP